MGIINYIKTNWTNTTAFNPTRMNNIENGIKSCADEFDNIINKHGTGLDEIKGSGYNIFNESTKNKLAYIYSASYGTFNIALYDTDGSAHYIAIEKDGTIKVAGSKKYYTVSEIDSKMFKTKDIAFQNISVTTKSSSGSYYNSTALSLGDIANSNVLGITVVSFVGAAANFTPYLNNQGEGIRLMSDISQTISSITLRILYK